MTAVVRFFIFVLGSLLLASLSWASLKTPASHGFTRFLAWECMLGLFALNVPLWFRDWLSWNQIISWFLLTCSLLPLILGVAALRAGGEPDRKRRPESDLLGFERTTKLVSSGIFRYIRHPLYCSLLLLNWGVFFKAPSAPGTALALSASLLLWVTARRDETECMRVFGDAYREYEQRTRMFIPHVF